MSEHTQKYPTRGDLEREQLRRRGVAYWNDVLEECRGRLEKLAAGARAAFAIACAERLVRAHEALPYEEQREATLDCRWAVDGMWARSGVTLEARPVTDDALDEFVAASDDEDEDTDDPADDTHNAVIYAVRCFRTGDVKEAIWAAGREVDLALYRVDAEMGLDENKFAWDPAADPPMPSAQYTMHPHVQATLARLRSDLDALEREGATAATLDALRARSRA